MALYLAFIFYGTQSKGFCLRDAQCDPHDAVFLELFLQYCIFSKSIGTVLLAGLL